LKQLEDATRRGCLDPAQFSSPGLTERFGLDVQVEYKNNNLHSFYLEVIRNLGKIIATEEVTHRCMCVQLFSLAGFFFSPPLFPAFGLSISVPVPAISGAVEKPS